MYLIEYTHTTIVIVSLLQLEAAFAFEREKLNVNDLRILIANDLFRMQHPAE